MKKLYVKIVLTVLCIALCFNFIFPNFSYAYILESTGNISHHILDLTQTEEEQVNFAKQEIINAIKTELNKNVIDPYVIRIGSSNINNLTDEVKNIIIEELVNYMQENVYTSESKLNDRFLNDFINQHLSSYIDYADRKQLVTDYVGSHEFLDEVLDVFYAKVENGVYLQQYIDGQGHTITEKEENNSDDPLKGKFTYGILDGVLGIILYPWKLAFVVPSAIIRVAINSIAGDNATLQTIFFNKVNLTNINIFEAGDGTINAKIAEFYVGLRNLSIALSLAMLIYIGIRMATNSIGEDKAKYKEMLKNWVVGFALIFVMQYIIFFVIKANELLIQSLELPGESQDVLRSLAGQIWAIPFTTSFASIVMYVGLVLMTFVFLITYIKRMITVSFLIVISPLISVTYAVDKAGNNKSEILNMWIREFLYNVLIQPFHCIIFSIFVYTAMDLITRETNFGSMAFAIILTFCIFTGQKLIREIFGFNNSKSFYEKALNFAIVTKIYSDIKNSINDVRTVKGARNDLEARKQQKILNGIEDSDEITGENMVKFRILAEENRNAKSGQTNVNEPKTVQNNSNNYTRRKIDINRPLKSAPRRVKRAARLYKNTMKKYTGYNVVNNAIKNRKNAKFNSTKLNNKDYAIALSEMYRQNTDSSLSNEELVSAYDRISTADVKDLTAEELSYKVRMAALKSQLKISDDEIKDAIMYGSSENKRWRG